MVAKNANAMNLNSAAGVVTWDGTSVMSATALTQYDVLTGGSTGNTINQVAPGSTSGVPLVSNGSSSQPSFSTCLVAGGGTGNISTTAYALICGGTTTTGAFQAVADVATGQVLTSGGTSALPAFSAYPQISGLGIGHSPGSTAGITFDGTSFLDNYVVGNWTPALAFGGSSSGITYSIQSGYYNRIGHICYINCEILLTSKGSATGTATVTLPLTSQSTDSMSCWFANVTLSGYSTAFDSYSGEFVVTTSGSGYTELTNTAFSNTSQIVIAGCYQC
jgi:hypothetical protein